MTVRLKKSDYDAIVGHAKAGLPNEACGLIAGIVQGDLKMVEKVYLLSNPDQSPEHFSIDPREQLAAVKDMRAHGAFLRLGIFILIPPLLRGLLRKTSGWLMTRKPAI